MEPEDMQRRIAVGYLLLHKV